MGSFGKKMVYRVILSFWLIALASCRPSPTTEPISNASERRTATSIPNTLLVTHTPSRQVNVPTVLSTTPIPPSTTLPIPTRSSQVDILTASETAVPPEAPPPSWVIYTEILEGIYIVRENGSGQRKILEPNNWEYPDFLSWSPDGQWISFCAYPFRSSDGYDIYLARPDGSQLRRLTYTPGDKRAKSWSPDGKSIVYSQTTDGESGQTEVDLFMVDIDTGRIRQITHTPDIYEHSPAFSPRGDAIVYTSIGVKDQPSFFHLMVMDLDGRNPRQLIEIPVKAGGIALSPNGAQIAFITPSPFSQKCKEDLYIVNWDGSDLRRLTNRPGSVNSPSWSFDGQWLAFSYSDSDSCVGGKKQINLMKSGGSGLIKFGSLFNVDPDPVWAPLPALQSGEMFTITESGAQLKLRASPSLTGEILERLEEGERILVLEGPEEADEYLWWQVRVSSSGREGWVAENPGWFAPGLP